MDESRETVTPEEDGHTPADLRAEWPALAFGGLMLLSLLAGLGWLVFAFL